MGLTPLGIALIGIEVRIVEWEVTMNMAKSTQKCMVEYMRRTAWSMAMYKLETKEKISLLNHFKVSCKE